MKTWRVFKNPGRVNPPSTHNTHRRQIMSKTPYELRFEIFKQAYNMLTDSFNTKIEVCFRNDEQVPSNLIDEYPTLDDVLNQADIINSFVSETK